MPNDLAELLVHSQMALQLTQQQLADLLGVSKRTVQRWQDRGGSLLPVHAERLASAVRSMRPDLAEKAMALGQAQAATLGVPGPAVPASVEAITSILEAAGEAAGLSSDAVRAAVTAAFEHADAEGLDVAAVIAGLASTP
jgi:hypothetical protein